MGLLVGLLLGIGLFLCLLSGRAPSARRAGVGSRLRDELAEAGLASLRPAHLALLSGGGSAVAAGLVLAASSTWSIAAVFGLFGAAAPWLVVRRRVRLLRRERRDLWPYVIDDLASGIRAGLSLPEAVGAVAERGPQPPGLRRLRSRIPGKRIVQVEHRATCRRARRSGRRSRRRGAAAGSGRRRHRCRPAAARCRAGTARGCAGRGEIEARQSWTVNGARLAVAAPWAVLLLLASHSSSIRVYDKPGGLVVLAIGGVLSVAAYLLMQRIGRLPTERRTAGVAR